LYASQNFYSYMPVLYELQEGTIKRKIWMSDKNAYTFKYNLWMKLKVK